MEEEERDLEEEDSGEDVEEGSLDSSGVEARATPSRRISHQAGMRREGNYKLDSVIQKLAGNTAINMGFRRSPPTFRVHNGFFGANFASGGSGILDSTGSTITMTQQVEDFSSLQTLIAKRVGKLSTKDLLSRSIFLISSGGNDLFAFGSRKPNATKDETEQFLAAMISNYQNHLQELYNLGARKFAVVNVPPIGCCPYSRTLHLSGLCLDGLNALALAFNEATENMFESLSSRMAGMRYSIGNAYTVLMSIIKDPEPLGFKDIKSACCGAGSFSAEHPCTQNATYCEDRQHHIF